MAASGTKDPLDVLQLMVNDVLVQTGKALRASRRDGPSGVNQANGSLQSKLPDTIQTFHSALDELERNIIGAKSVLLRDLTQLRAPEALEESPEPVDAQTRSPMVIDLDSSPPPAIKSEPMPDNTANTGSAESASAEVTEAAKAEPAPPTESQVKTEADTSPDQQPSTSVAESKPEEDKAGAADLQGALQASNPELNFTDMEFTLAPTGSESQAQTSTQEPSFDLTAFAPPDAEDGLLSLDLLQPGTADDGNIQASVEQGNLEEKKDDANDPSLDDLFNADTIDFDFSVGGEGTFDELMNNRDDDGFDMEHGDFDSKFFGLDKPDET